MDGFWTAIGSAIASASDFVCGYPLFIVLMGGGVFFLFYSGFAPLRHYGKAVRALRKSDTRGKGQISPAETFVSAVAATVGVGNIAGVTIAISVGGPGAVFWMWVSALLGMATKLFEGTLATMYKGKDSDGEVQGGMMYIVQSALGRRWKPVAVIFASFCLIETLCLMQSNQLAEIITTIFADPQSDHTMLHLITGIVITAIVSVVVLGGIKRIASLATRIVPFMVGLYFLTVLYIIVTHIGTIPGVFKAIFVEAFRPGAVAGGGIAALIFVAMTGIRRAMIVNEAGMGTATLMHGSSKQSEPVKEGLSAMICPSIDSGLICTLTAIAILVQRDLIPAGGGLNSMQGLKLAVTSFDASIPGVGKYLLLAVIFCFAFSTMFSYSYYGQKCTGYLFGAKYAKYYSIPYLCMLLVAAVIPLRTAVSLVDLAGGIMTLCTMAVLLRLAPKAREEFKKFFENKDKSI